MSSNVGLSTPRGSGTSGYVQRNLAHIKPRDQAKPYDIDSLKHRQRQPDKDILEHERKREVEVKVFELRDKLEEEGVDEEEIEVQEAALRKKLLNEMGRGSGSNRKGLKIHQVHELAQAKAEQDNKFKRALGIPKNYEEGGHWKKQAEKQKAAMGSEEGTSSADPSSR
ncbi:hypothetical protein CJF30_00006665 [Rutstroemia sp. NJR-2017a BBW]|nr:hypothetical protein CJF30_00006665 [Rutstroemia sp. NJR-2017a BBW]